MATITTAPPEEELAVENDARPITSRPMRAKWTSNQFVRTELAPLTVVILTVAVNLWVLRGELTSAQNLNDGAFHISMIRWASEQIHKGRIPLDGWYPYLSMGLPQFHHYQSLPHLVSGYLANRVGSDQAYLWTLYGLLATWPLSIYLGARLLGLKAWPAAVAAALSPLLQSTSGYGLEDGSYTWRGLGLWTQLWGAWLLPISLGLSYRAIVKRKSIALAALAVALTFACNFITGYLAFLVLPLFAIVSRADVLRRFARAALVGLGAAAAGSWVIVPLLADRDWSNQSEFFTGFWRDSFGAPQVLRWLATGSLYDERHLPVVTLLLAAGLVASVVRFTRDEPSRALLLVWLVSILLFFGRPTLGPLVDLLPGSGDLMLHRFILAAHLAGLFLAGMGGAWIAQLLLRLRRRLHSTSLQTGAMVLFGCAAAALVAPAWVQRASFNAAGADWIRQQAVQDVLNADVIGLIEEAKRTGGGRIYAGSNFNWGKQYRVGFVPIYTMLLNYDAPAVGFNMRTIQSLSHDVESRFDENDPAHYELFNVKYLIFPVDRDPPIEASIVSQRGNTTLWKVETSGYLSVIDTRGSITADRTNLGVQTDQLLKSLAQGASPLPTVAFAGRAAEPATIGRSLQEKPPGRGFRETDHPSDGKFTARIDANRQSVVLLKATFHPRWTATVDGKKSPTFMVAPSFTGVKVGAGTHSIEFTYQPFAYYPLAIFLGIDALIAIEVFQRYLRRRWIPIDRH